MRVLLAGASGALGTPLTRQLIAAGHQVVGISRSEANAERLRTAGAEAVVADVMGRENLLSALRDVRADAVMHQLTALGGKMREAVRGTNNLRTTGTAHLLAAARAVGAHRFLTQSNVYGYGYRDHGPHLITEDDPFAEPARGRLGQALAAIRSTEQQVFSADEMEGIALRYGAYYGQDNFTRMISNLVLRRRLRCPRPAAASPPSSTWRTPRPLPQPPWGKGAPDRRTTSSTTSRCAGPITWTRSRPNSGCAGRGGCPAGRCERSRTSARS
jgi:nucleoside-diphosphate-sugar epimerase